MIHNGEEKSHSKPQALIPTPTESKTFLDSECSDYCEQTSTQAQQTDLQKRKTHKIGNPPKSGKDLQNSRNYKRKMYIIVPVIC